MSYDVPEGLTVMGGVQSIFQFYCAPVKSTASSSAAHDVAPTTMDGVSFARMCKDAPSMGGYNLQRFDMDIIFSKAKPVGGRRLNFEQFLNALLELAVYLNRDIPPQTAVARLFVRHIFGLFDQDPSTEPSAEIEARIISELRDSD
jgi:hypothetical protein